MWGYLSSLLSHIVTVSRFLCRKINVLDSRVLPSSAGGIYQLSYCFAISDSQNYGLKQQSAFIITPDSMGWWAQLGSSSPPHVCCVLTSCGGSPGLGLLTWVTHLAGSGSWAGPSLGSDVSGILHNLLHVTRLGLSMAAGFWEGEVQEDWRKAADFLRPKLKVYSVTYTAYSWPKQVTCQPKFKDKGSWVPLSGRSGKEFLAIVTPRQAVLYSVV